ncbi:hypothetical protein OE88DRAFT_586932 [Heliocybe sulcata]|uniref:Uncharacterized protein n=1 Tax=Heliocybe sulcata TaxID=5364 RepID=A0A5C3MSG0_9AGAM|nr:hypothetical protein OE88DRAFT_586932 [Heliocybe sulcata]
MVLRPTSARSCWLLRQLQGQCGPNDLRCFFPWTGARSILPDARDSEDFTRPLYRLTFILFEETIYISDRRQDQHHPTAENKTPTCWGLFTIATNLSISLPSTESGVPSPLRLVSEELRWVTSIYRIVSTDSSPCGARNGRSMCKRWQYMGAPAPQKHV